MLDRHRHGQRHQRQPAAGGIRLGDAADRVPGRSDLLHSYAPAGTPVSSDPDGDSLTYLWTKTAGPAVTLANATSATACIRRAACARQSYSRDSSSCGVGPTTGGLIGTDLRRRQRHANLPPIARAGLSGTCRRARPRRARRQHAPLPRNGGTLTLCLDPDCWAHRASSWADATASAADFDAPSLTAEFRRLAGIPAARSPIPTAIRGPYSLAHCAVQIDDITPPQLSVPADIVIEAASSCPGDGDLERPRPGCGRGRGALPAAGQRVHTAIGQPVFTRQLLPPRSTPARSTARHLIWRTTAGPASFHVSVQDTTAPVITAPGGVAAPATGPLGALVDFDATTSDAVDGPGAATCVPAGHTTFALGDTLGDLHRRRRPRQHRRAEELHGQCVRPHAAGHHRHGQPDAGSDIGIRRGGDLLAGRDRRRRWRRPGGMFSELRRHLPARNDHGLVHRDGSFAQHRTGQFRHHRRRHHGTGDLRRRPHRENARSHLA